MGRKLQGSDEGDRQIVKVRSAVLTDGLTAVGRPAPKPSPTASIPPASFSISCRGTVTPGQRQRS
jgi:hypothetical protein